jgi:cell division protein FtsB
MVRAISTRRHIGVTMEKVLFLSSEWEKYMELRAEGDKLRAEGDKLRAEGDKLRAEGDKLRAEGKINWMTAVIAAYGNCTVEWSETGCTLENGDLYEYETERNL